MENIAILIIFHSILIRQIDALQCYSCTYFEAESNVPILGTIIGQLSRLSKDTCKLEKPNDYADISTRNCPDPTNSNKVARCMTLDGELTVTQFGFSVKLLTVIRGCSEVTVSVSRSTTDGCHSLSSEVIDYFFQVASFLRIADIKFTGNECYSAKSLGNDAVNLSTNTSKILMFLAIVVATGFT